MAMTLFIELFKLTLSLAIYFTSGESSENISTRSRILIKKWPDGAYFILPAVVYGLYNGATGWDAVAVSLNLSLGLAFINLNLLEPGTYRVLINTRIIFSGLLIQCVYRKWLTSRQWLGLVLLMIACVVEQSGSFSTESGLVAVVMMSLQGLCSSLGGVYFQWLLQHQESMGIWLKNIYLYFWSIVVNLVAIVVFRPDLLYPANLLIGFDGQAVAIIIVATLGGICTSLVLQHLDVLIKEYANFAEMVVVAVMQRAMFGTSLRFTLVLAIIMVSYSLYLYQVPSRANKSLHATRAAHLTDIKSVAS